MFIKFKEISDKFKNNFREKKVIKNDVEDVKIKINIVFIS